ncbi:helicase-related protein [Dolichospermum sp. LEGE 00246]|uniref:helicase-related protein n=1 Tax=Dolichospermum sp. LEGE 00246 TaxID=1828605 RepID=UPI00351C4A8E
MSAAFRDHVSVLLASKTGGEYRNIQFANAIVNYDLPWNSMKIEQWTYSPHCPGNFF